MRALVALPVAVVAACGGAPAPAPLSQQRDAPALATGPAPVIGWAFNRFTVTGLPAVAADGSLAVATVRDPDGGRGYPNLTLVVRDRSDRLVNTIEVMAANEYEPFDAQDDAGPQLAARIASANRALGELHARVSLVPMVPAEGIAAEWSAPRLHVRTPDGRQLHAVDGTSWLAPSGPRCQQCPPCENPAYVASMHAAPSVERVLLVTIAYEGTDSCWEPASQPHVVAW